LVFAGGSLKQNGLGKQPEDEQSKTIGNRKSAMPSQLLNKQSLTEIARDLASRDKQLAEIFNQHGPPPLWRRATGFATLVHIILEQQVSLRSGKAMFDRLSEAIDPFSPEEFVGRGENFLRSLGVTRQKSSYLIHLASLVAGNELNLRQLTRMNDYDARLSLMQVKGIGSWSADVYLLMAMLRADIWPSGDLALAVAAQDLMGVRIRPTPEELETLAERWRPHRAVAARMLWQYYLAKKAEAKSR
jgi:DNA-3-methyladenine glycosylase II